MTKLLQDQAAQPFGFKRADQIPQHQLQALNFVHERAAKELTAALSAYLRTEVQVLLLVTSQNRFAEFAGAAADPTCAVSLTMGSNEGTAVLEVLPAVAFSMMDRLLGGEGKPMPNLRPLTELEKSIMQGPLRIIADELSKAWKQTHPLEFRVLETHANLQQVQGLTAGDPVTVVDFQIRMHDDASRIRLALPSRTMDAVFRQAEKDPQGRKRGVEDPALVSQIRRIPVSLSIETPETQFPIEAIVSLKPGDTLLLDQRDEWPVLLKVAGRTKLHVQSRKDTQRKAFTVIARHRAGTEERHEFSSPR
jgi:flagellar motor switch protein FliM